MQLPINQRIETINKIVFNDNKSDFGKAIGKTYQYINNYTNAEKGINLKIFLKIYSVVKDKISAEWYLTGIGNPNKTNAYIQNETPSNVSEPQSEYNNSNINYEKIIADKNAIIESQQKIIALLEKQHK